jgi:hypothetical protein
MYFQNWLKWEHTSWGFYRATRSNRMPSLSRVSKAWTYWRLKMKVVVSFGTSGSVYLFTHLLIAEELNSWLQRCVHLRTRTAYQRYVRDRYLTQIWHLLPSEWRDLQAVALCLSVCHISYTFYRPLFVKLYDAFRSRLVGEWEFGKIVLLVKCVINTTISVQSSTQFEKQSVCLHGSDSAIVWRNGRWDAICSSSSVNCVKL